MSLLYVALWKIPLVLKGFNTVRQIWIIEIVLNSKTCVKHPLKNRQNKDLHDKW